MSEQILKQLAVGGLAFLIGLSGWVLPYRWNLLRLKGFLARRLSEETNRKIPKRVGTVLMVVGAAIMIATAFVGSFE